ncbi:MAG: hypothetical protein AAGA75_15050 [Cyanobacteria bacterium P01_E01_bin.6]
MVLVTVIVAVVLLVAWALRLMQCAIDQREFSLMLAGLLVSSAAAGLVGVYFLMSNCFSYMTALPQPTNIRLQVSEVEDWDRDVLFQYGATIEKNFGKG